MERAIAVSVKTVGSHGLYSSIVTTAPGEQTRVHHHGDCETSIYILSGEAHYTFGPTGVEEQFDAAAGDFVYIPAGEIHVEANRVGDRAARRPPVAQLPGFAERVPVRRRAGVRLDARRWSRSPTSSGATAWRTSREAPFPNDGWSGARLGAARARRRSGSSSSATASPGTGSPGRPATGRSCARRGSRRTGRPCRRRSGRRTSVPARTRRPDPGRSRCSCPTSRAASCCPGRRPPTSRRPIARSGRWRPCMPIAWPAGALADGPWCPLRERLLLLSRPAAERYRAEGNPVGERFLAGWDAFDAAVPPAARDLIADLAARAGAAPGGARPTAGDPHPRRPQAGQRRLRAGRADRAHRLADGHRRPGRGRARLVPRLERAVAADRAAGRPRPLPGRPLEAAGGAASRRASGRRRSTWRSSSGCCCAAGARASTRPPRPGTRRASGPTDDLAWWCRRAVEAAARRL